MFLERGLHKFVRAPDEPIDHVCLAQQPAQLAEHQHVYFDRETLAIEQYAVAVEDHEFNGGGHRKALMERCSTWRPAPRRCGGG
jgi:hypothetical protein